MSHSFPKPNLAIDKKEMISLPSLWQRSGAGFIEEGMSIAVSYWLDYEAEIFSKCVRVCMCDVL